MKSIYSFNERNKKPLPHLCPEEIQCSIIGNILFGSRSRNCGGHGICEVVRVEEGIVPKHAWSPCQTIGQIVHLTNGNYVFNVLKSSVSVGLYNRQFSDVYFKVDEDFDMRTVFGLANPSIIKKGIYNFWEDQNFVYIDFTR